MQRTPLTLFCTKIERAHRRVQIRVSFQQILESAVEDQELEGVEAKLIRTFNARKVSRVFNVLRKAHQLRKKANHVAQQAKVSLVGRTFYSWMEKLDQSLI